MGNFRRNDHGPSRGYNGGDRGFRGGFAEKSFGPKPSFRTNCAACGESCEVPFRPNGSKPVYCRSCFKKEGGDAPTSQFSKFSGPQGEKRLFTATCASCGESCEVPFRPNGSKPVYCRNCFKRDDAGGSAPREMRSDSRNESRSDERVMGQLSLVNAKLDQLLKLMGGAPAPATPKTAVPATSKTAPAAKPAAAAKPAVTAELVLDAVAPEEKPVKPAKKAAKKKTAKAKA